MNRIRRHELDWNSLGQDPKPESCVMFLRVPQENKMHHHLINYKLLKVILYHAVSKFMSCSTDLSNRITPQQLEDAGIPSLTESAHTQEGRDLGRNFNNLSLETSFLPPPKAATRRARSKLRDPFPATTATTALRRMRWQHQKAFPVYGDEKQQLHFMDGMSAGSVLMIKEVFVISKERGLASGLMYG